MIISNWLKSRPYFIGGLAGLATLAIFYVLMLITPGVDDMGNIYLWIIYMPPIYVLRIFRKMPYLYFVLIHLFLLAQYFIIGALIGWLYGMIKK